MKYSRSESKQWIRSAGLGLAVAGFTLFLCANSGLAQGADKRAPAVPASLQVPAGNKVHVHAYAAGVQIYAWSGTAWVFQGPEAVLYANAGLNGEIGIHYAYAGPTRPAWESQSGSLVVGARVAGVTVTANAIPWLLLSAVQTSGPGPLAITTYIQRVNTTGGLAPATPGTSAGQIARVPYTAEYFFFRADPSAAAAN